MSASPAQADPELDHGPRRRGSETERLCIATRSLQPLSAMIRFVPAPDGTVVPDLKRRLPGRGVWVTARRDALAEAVRRQAFARSLKRPVRVGPDLVATTEELLRRAVLEMLAMANKAGLVVAGFAKVQAALAGKDAAALIRAVEASADGVRKITALARGARGPESGELPVLVFPTADLDLSLGRTNVIHAALLAGAASEAVLARYRAFLAFGESATPEAEERSGAE